MIAAGPRKAPLAVASPPGRLPAAARRILSLDERLAEGNVVRAAGRVSAVSAARASAACRGRSRLRRLALVVLLGLLPATLLSSCSGSGATDGDTELSAPRVVSPPAPDSGVGESSGSAAIRVCGPDRTGSYDFVPVGLEMCARVIAAALPGDEVIIRWISDSSYANSEFVTRLALPLAGENCSRNPFDAACRRAERALQARLAALKRAEVEALLALHPSSAPLTDIMGFLQAASDEFTADTLGREHWIYMATDLENNVGYRVEPDLRGAHVVVFALETPANPERAVALRDEWRERLNRLGAVDVQFHAAEVKR